jgi:hypothetical protein
LRPFLQVKRPVRGGNVRQPFQFATANCAEYFTRTRG